jgi:hypothetical protein
MVPAHVERRHLALAAGGAAALLVVGMIDPAVHALGPPCPLRRFTGLDCPLCGATRATHHLLRADIVGALDLNALYVLGLPIVIVIGVMWLVRGSTPAWASRAEFRWCAIGLAVAFAIVRNLPFMPFSVLGSAGVGQ